jgi:cold shock CspA family protein
MVLPVQISFRNLEASADLEELIRNEAAGLETYYDQIMSCHVMVEVPHEHHQHGKHFHVRIDLIVPGGELVVRNEPSLRSAERELDVEENLKRFELQEPHKHLEVAISDAFDTARRRLQDYARRRRGAVKFHEPSPHGRVSALFPDYGFIETPDGIEIYFHRNSLLSDDFDRLEVGSEVHFVEEQGDEGPQASTVKVVGAQRPAGS